MKQLSLIVVVFALLGTTVLGGCAGRRGGELPAALTEAETADPSMGHVQQVTRLARRNIEQELRTRNQDRHTVQFSRPYYFKEYAEFPQGSDQIDVVLQETDSRTAPVRARATFPKVRYVTKLHTRRAAAEADSNFYRDTGEETLVYELRNNRWVLLGGTFVAERSEEQVAGEWRPVQDRTPRLTPREAPKGFFGRTWDRLTGD